MSSSPTPLNADELKTLYQTLYFSSAPTAKLSRGMIRERYRELTGREIVKDIPRGVDPKSKKSSGR